MHISLDDPVCIHQHNIKRSTGDSIKVVMANQSAREFLESSKGVVTSISVLFIFGYFMNTFSHKSMIRIGPK